MGSRIEDECSIGADQRWSSHNTPVAVRSDRTLLARCAVSHIDDCLAIQTSPVVERFQFVVDSCVVYHSKDDCRAILDGSGDPRREDGTAGDELLHGGAARRAIPDV